MNIFHKLFNPPAVLSTRELEIFPTSLDYYESDYEAVMSSKEILRLWSQSDWPSEHFTAQENKDDLKYHIEDNYEHRAYGYMLYSPDRKTCYGSLYVNPLKTIPENYELSDENFVKEFDARLDFWIRDNDGVLEEMITRNLIRWMKDHWDINPLFSARAGMDLRIKTYQKLGLNLKYDLKGKDQKTSLLLFK